MIDKANDSLETFSWKEHRVLVGDGKGWIPVAASGISVSASIW